MYKHFYIFSLKQFAYHHFLHAMGHKNLKTRKNLWDGKILVDDLTTVKIINYANNKNKSICWLLTIEGI